MVETLEDRTRKPSDLLRQLDHYRLTTAEILYRLPDHPALLQSYLWQDYDLAPRFPVLHKFLDFWTRELDGPLYRVRVAAVSEITPGHWHARRDYSAQERRLH